MSDMSGPEILSGKKTGDAAQEESASAIKTTSRDACVDWEPQTHPSRAMHRTLARHVDAAATQTKINKPPDTYVHFSFHKSSRHAAGFRAAFSQDRQSFAALVLPRRVVIHSYSFPSPAGDCRSSALSVSG